MNTKIIGTNEMKIVFLFYFSTHKNPQQLKGQNASQIWENERKHFLRAGHVTNKDEILKPRY